MWPPHSTSTLGLSTVKNCTRFKSLRPQNSTSNLINYYYQHQTKTLRDYLTGPAPVFDQGWLYLGGYRHDGARVLVWLILDRGHRGQRPLGVPQLEHLEGSQQFPCYNIGRVRGEMTMLTGGDLSWYWKLISHLHPHFPCRFETIPV